MEVAYFESPGKQNTEKALEIARDYAKKHGIKNIVVASTTGFTAEKASEVFKGFNLVIVTHLTGYLEPDHQQFPKDLRKKLEAKGILVLTTAHAFSGINKILGEYSLGEIIANTLRMFCEGVKVAVEIAAMAADAGLVSTKEDILSIAGTGKGADTVLLVRPANSRNLFDLEIKKILAKPI